MSPETSTNDARQSQPTRLTDSPWFWVYVFSTGAFAALMLMQTKYQNRQGHLERLYRYGTRTLSRPAGATLSDGAAASRSETAAAEPIAVADGSAAALPDDASEQPLFAADPRPPMQKLLITLGPLRMIVGATMVFAFMALQWSYWRRRAKAMQ